MGSQKSACAADLGWSVCAACRVATDLWEPGGEAPSGHPTDAPPDPTKTPGQSLKPSSGTLQALDHGEVVELDGGTLVLDSEESPSVVLRLAPWHARSVARVLQEWSSVSRIFQHQHRPYLHELDLSRTLEMAAAVLANSDESSVRSPRGSRMIPNQQRLAALAVLGEREPQLSAVQRLALVDAAAWWLSEPNGGEELAYALLAASCSAEITTEHVYLVLIAPSGESD